MPAKTESNRTAIQDRIQPHRDLLNQRRMQGHLRAGMRYAEPVIPLVPVRGD
ncbi:hypothetical protein [Xanthomonas campestris]|uniref:hypothetical protein n=1 Tax=Xanthomonas campestris TaxID=339 RepID=UPI0013010B71|nr:hypothetical protein [Xanthomonas campestris]MCF8826329.1 hypothetical protein [Xanthomonas campestris pv. raphani]MEA9874999.1 hypothetical protein [Xanthomonas campestris pv. raphani]QLC69741.1 hypothetical protein AD14011_09590 [Xanthomonas campestris pv. raphani]